MSPLRIDIHTHLLPSPLREEKELLLYDLPFPEKISQGLFPLPTPDDVFFSAGIHPNCIYPENEEEKLFPALEELITSRRIIAIGECGLDKNSPLSREKQMERFRKQILLSEKYSLPLILHNVRMWDEVFFLRKECHCHLPWIAHNFRGSVPLAKELEKKGIYISFAPVFLEKSGELQEYKTLSHVFLETDECNTPLSILYKLLAEKWEMEEEELQARAEKSFKEVFYAGK